MIYCPHGRTAGAICPHCLGLDGKVVIHVDGELVGVADSIEVSEPDPKHEEAYTMVMKAGQDVGCEPEKPESKIPKPFRGLGPGRIVHVWVRLSVAEQPRVVRPAIVTEVLCHERGIVAAHVVKSPTDPPGEIIVHGPVGPRPLGAELHHADRDRLEDWTWHWPERA
jgi:hypothetical protein